MARHWEPHPGLAGLTHKPRRAVYVGLLGLTRTSFCRENYEPCWPRGGKTAKGKLILLTNLSVALYLDGKKMTRKETEGRVLR